LSNFITDYNVPLGNVGPLGIAFPDSGGVLVATWGGGVRLFAYSDGQSAARTPPSQGFGQGNAVDLAKVGGKIYMTQGTAGRLVQLNDDGTLKKVIFGSGLPLALGMAVNSSNGHVFISAPGANTIFDFDPVAQTLTPFVSGVFDGLTISADGSTLYGAE